MAKILIIDEGTSSTRACIYDNMVRGEFFQKEIPLISPSPEIVEQDALLIWEKSLESAKLACTQNYPEMIGITNQRETTILWDKDTGVPVYHAIIWQDRRGKDFCEYLKQNGLEEIINKKTGLLADPYFSAFKIHWLLTNIKGLKERAQNGEILFGNVDTWLIWNLTQGKSHVTDASNASRTCLYNIIKDEWDEELLEIFDIPKAILPKVLNSHDDFGTCELFGASIKIKGVLGDQQSALMGQDCKEAKSAKITFGTGAFMMVQIGEKPIYSRHKMLLTIASKIDGKINYALEGSVLNAGTVVQWLRDEMGIIKSAKETEELAKSISENGGIYFVPSFTGLGAPYWNANVKGAILGIGRKTEKAHIVRAALEACAYQTFDLLEAFKNDGVEIKNLRIDGGMAKNSFFCQFLADICNITIERPDDFEMTALGAAKIANILKHQETIKFDTFTPKMSAEKRKQNIEGWKRAIKAVIAFSE